MSTAEDHAPRQTARLPHRLERRAIRISGIVQGVGFRPFVHALATGLALAGWVRNQTGTVHIEAEGPPDALEAFVARLAADAPPLARIDELTWAPQPPRGTDGFHIQHSQADAEGRVFISPDAATCAGCLAELFDPADRRFGYPFLNCTQCGPRLTIITGSPYDRPKTTMAGFPMCADCRAEYEDPTDRRFHAQPTACWVCGPQLELWDETGQVLPADDPLKEFVAFLLDGGIGAMKGLGGYHLVCDATRPESVAALRTRKLREEKPFAIMVADLEAARALCCVSREERDVLQAPAAPIVLLQRLGGSLAAAVAPGNPYLGVMLPYTPLHHLLLRQMGRPVVLTSGNRSDEPIAYENPQVVQQLTGIADRFLTHNRPIRLRCDDSVTRIVAGAELPLRRSRGYAPAPIRMPVQQPVPVLAVGGQLKGVFGLGREGQAFLSHHLGDLDHWEANRAFERDLPLFEELFQFRPQCIVHDLHPDYASTRYALKRAEQEGLQRLAVQHHHAHLASCMAENGLDQPVIGVTFDGTGYGPDGAVWGGEFLIGDYAGYQRAAHFRYVGMPGGEQAIKEPWRMALAHLRDAGEPVDLLPADLPGSAVGVVDQMLERRVNTPMTSSAGRLFDAVAALVGLRQRVSYEGQAAMELEWAARGHRKGGYSWTVRGRYSDGPLEVDTRPLVQTVAEDVRRGASISQVAARFHNTLADLIGAVCRRLREETGVTTVVLSGGVFHNARLTQTAIPILAKRGFQVYRHRRVPPGDGGLALGQLAIAARFDD